MQSASSTLNTCLGADQATWTPLGTRCYDFVRLWVGRDLDNSREVWSCNEVIQHHTSHVGQKKCFSRLTGNFWNMYWLWAPLVGLMCSGCWSWFHSKGSWMAVLEGLRMQDPIFADREFLNYCKNGTVHECAWVLCSKVATFQWNKRGALNFAVTCHLMFIAQGTLLSESPSNIKQLPLVAFILIHCMPGVHNWFL
jgi:hypothetical protein